MFVCVCQVYSSDIGKKQVNIIYVYVFGYVCVCVCACVRARLRVYLYLFIRVCLFGYPREWCTPARAHARVCVFYKNMRALPSFFVLFL